MIQASWGSKMKNMLKLDSNRGQMRRSHKLHPRGDAQKASELRGDYFHGSANIFSH